VIVLQCAFKIQLIKIILLVISSSSKGFQVSCLEIGKSLGSTS
jgi:hypothetical protein